MYFLQPHTFKSVSRLKVFPYSRLKIMRLKVKKEGKTGARLQLYLMYTRKYADNIADTKLFDMFI